MFCPLQITLTSVFGEGGGKPLILQANSAPSVVLCGVNQPPPRCRRVQLRVLAAYLSVLRQLKVVCWPILF